LFFFLPYLQGDKYQVLDLTTRRELYFTSPIFKYITSGINFVGLRVKMSDIDEAQSTSSSKVEGETHGSEDVLKDETQSEAQELPVTTDDLIPLIKAITFAYPHYAGSPEKIHEEIVSVASKQEPLLASISFKEVQTAYQVLADRTRKEDEMKQKVIKMYTIGDTTGTKHAVAVGSESPINLTASETPARRWVRVQLDVPADTSGTKPHQALINFTEQSSSADSGSDDGKPSALTACTSTSSPSSSDQAFIVKIQVAMGGIQTRAPMLLYNIDRTMKTFIHCTEEGAEGYYRIQEMIINHGTEGALGKAGGSKAYFHAIKYFNSQRKDDATSSVQSELTERSKIIRIDCHSLASDQTW